MGRRPTNRERSAAARAAVSRRPVVGGWRATAHLNGGDHHGIGASRRAARRALARRLAEERRRADILHPAMPGHPEGNARGAWHAAAAALIGLVLGAVLSYF